MAIYKTAPPTIWAKNSPWGYLFNINHPNVKRAYLKYQQEHGLDVSISMTDAQRHAFEDELLEKLKAGKFMIPPHID